MQRIFVTDFLIRLNCLAEGNFIERNYFAFHILDGDRDGIIGSTDLQNIQAELLTPFCEDRKSQIARDTSGALLNQCKCILSSEINRLYKYFYEAQCMKVGNQQKETITLAKFV